MINCPHCQSDQTIKRGRGNRQCKECHKYFGAEVERHQTAFEENIRTGTGVVSSRVTRHLTEDEIAQKFQIDTAVWSIDRIVYAEHEGYRKDRSVEWKVEDGMVRSGEVHDSGRLRIEPLIGIKVYLSRRSAHIQDSKRLADFVTDAKKFSPKYPKIKYPKIKDPVMYEIEMPDLQLGRMVMESEAGAELTPDIAVQAARTSLTTLLGYAKLFPVERIIFPVGHDFFDANSSGNTTAHGTPQRDDPRWQRTFRLGRQLLIDVIDQMSVIAPVDVPVIVGNHDEERMFYMGEVLDAWYHRNPNVSVDNGDRKRKYRMYGANLLGFTHGYWEKFSELAELMAIEEPERWAKARHREFHLGDKHHMKVFRPVVEERKGVVVRLMRSLATPSVWEFDNGFVGSLQAVEGYIWHPEQGNIAQFLA